MATEKQIPHLAGLLVMHQKHFASIPTETADAIMKEPDLAMQLTVDMLNQRFGTSAEESIKLVTTFQVPAIQAQDVREALKGNGVSRAVISRSEGFSYDGELFFEESATPSMKLYVSQIESGVTWSAVLQWLAIGRVVTIGQLSIVARSRYLPLLGGVFDKNGTVLPVQIGHGSNGLTIWGNSLPLKGAAEKGLFILHR